MPERSFSVTLAARVDSYVAAMNKAKAATTGFSKDTQTNLTQLGTSMQSVGKKMTLGISLPIVAAGGLATKMSLDFDNAFTRMQTLAGVTGDEIDGMKQHVLDLAGETGRAPQELANAMYFLRSSGLDAGEAMDALDASAKASAAGLGDTAIIADAVSSAMNAYAASGLDAAEATDVLVATARAGKAEPEELAGSLGRILPISSELGVSFAETGGLLAALSQTGNDANQSVTLLSNVMLKILKPSEQGAKMLKAVGLSAQSLRDSIASQGLLGTLQDLREQLGDAGFNQFIQDQQAVVGALSITGDNLARTQTAVDQVTNSAGDSADAFAKWAASMGAQNAKAFAEFQAAMIQAGDVILPFVTKILSGAADIASAFSDLPEPVQTLVVAMLGLAAVAGPIVVMAGTVITNLELITAALARLGDQAVVTQGELATVGTAQGVQTIEILGRQLVITGASAGGAAIEFGTLASTLVVADLAMTDFQGNARDWGAVGEGAKALFTGKVFTPGYWSGLEASVKPGMAAYADGVNAAAAASAAATPAIDAFGTAATDSVGKLATSTSSASDIFDHLQHQLPAEAMSSAVELFGHTAGTAFHEAEAAADGAARAADDLRASWDMLIGSGLNAQEAVDNQIAALDDLGQRVKDVHAKQLLLAAVEQERARGHDDDADALQREADSLGDITLSLGNNTAAGRENRAMIRENVAAIQTRVAGELEDGRSTGRVTEIYRSQRDALIDQVSAFTGSRASARDYINQLGLTPKTIRTLIDENAGEAQGHVNSYRTTIDRLPDSKVFNAYANTGSASSAVANFRSQIDSLHDKTITIFTRVVGNQLVNQFASGGRVGPGGGIAGEAGPELVAKGGRAMMVASPTVVPPGAQVTPLGQVDFFAAGTTPRTRIRDLERTSAGFAVDADKLREQAAATLLLAKATKDADDKEKLLAQREKMLEQAETATTRAVKNAEAARDLLAKMIQRNSDDLQGDADAIRKHADALRDDADAAIKAGDAQAEALRGRAESLRQAYDAEQQLVDVQRARAEAQVALQDANRQQTIGGVTTFVHTEQERVDALEKARDAALAVADAEVQLARERTEITGKRFTDIAAATKLRESLLAQHQGGLVQELGIPQQIRLLQQAGREAASGRDQAARFRHNAKALDMHAKEVQHNSNVLEHLSNRIDRINLERPINVAIHTDGTMGERQVVRLIRRALDGVNS